MNRREGLALAAAFLGAAGMPRAVRAQETPAPAPAPTPESGDAIFARAKAAWRARAEAPFVQFALRERYVWRAKVHDNWWRVAYRASDRALALTRTIVAEDEADRLRGSPIALNFHWHHGTGRADSLDTNGGADAFPILDPLIEPTASFGLLRREPRAVLAGGGSQPGAATTPEPSPAPLASDAPPAAGALRELARVEASSRDYAIAVAGTERVRGADAYHLTLTPLRAPGRYRLRDLWVDAATAQTLQLAVHGLFDGKPYEDARWLVTYVTLEGLGYVQQIRTDDTLRFGFDRFVTGLQYDFVGYAFPAAIPPLEFERLL